MPSTAPELWFPFRSTTREHQTLRLFCFPNAGGSASMFRQWLHDFLPDAVEVCPVQLPGRERRLRETPYTQIEPLIDVLSDVITPYLDRPFAFFGHSMGTMVAYELTHRLRANGQPVPQHLMVAGRRAPHLPDEKEPAYALPDDELIQRLRDYDGTPAAVLDNQELMELILPVIRADFELVETYRPTNRPPLSMPIDAFGGHDDEDTPRESLDAWAEHTEGPCDTHMLAGGHFFLHEHPADLATRLRPILDGILASPALS